MVPIDLAWVGIATNLQVVKNAISTKFNKMRYAYVRLDSHKGTGNSLLVFYTFVILYYCPFFGDSLGVLKSIETD